MGCKKKNNKTSPSINAGPNEAFGGTKELPPQEPRGCVKDINQNK